MLSLGFVYLSTLFQLLIPAATAIASRTKPCTHNTFVSLGLLNINVLSLDVALGNAAWPSPSSLLNAYPTTKNYTIDVCQLTVNYTHPGWNDKITTWISLPLDSWNGRFAGMGGGGWVTGSLGALSQAVFQGYAAASTDGGHEETASIESWVLASKGNLNWANIQDFSAIALDEAASLGKAATELFYGRPPKYSYWNGCSTGGRQGHMMAQRFPAQYDGILAGAPAINWDKFIPAEYWPQVVIKELEYYPSPCEIDAITKYAIQACDQLDGVKDGIISMPGLCHFEPLSVVGKTVRCTAPNGTIKISKKAAKFAASVWAGAKSSDGSSLWYGSLHETPLTALGGTKCVSLTSCDPVPFTISADWLRAFISRDSSLDLSTINHQVFNRLFRASVNGFSSVMGTRDPDLTGFKQSGGKMITWHGMKDELIFYNGTEDYYRQALEADPELHDYYRFFPAPGVEHCGGGPGWYPGDSFQALVDWVEKGVAPDTLRAIATPSATGDAHPPLRTADLCAYPKVLTFVGGDPDRASSFTCK
ncbi:tannase and feruloyl esterase [Aspergillus cavernicola]|uniref:Carboxylic ester hydrolase n=1 Tax=Aspergillus cavernicola TaxID=176166 RepID=A0ABR4HMP2_9EURO